MIDSLKENVENDKESDERNRVKLGMKEAGRETKIIEGEKRKEEKDR